MKKIIDWKTYAQCNGGLLIGITISQLATEFSMQALLYQLALAIALNGALIIAGNYLNSR